jgi:hypothetical protein
MDPIPAGAGPDCQQDITDAVGGGPDQVALAQEPDAHCVD